MAPSNPSADEKTSLLVGLNDPQTEADVSQQLLNAREDGFHFVTTPLPHLGSPPRGDVASLPSRWWKTSVLGTAAECADLSVFLAHLPSQLKWAWHMNLAAVLLPRIPSAPGKPFAQAVCRAAIKAQQSNAEIWIRVALTEASLTDYENLVLACDGMPNIGMVLELDGRDALDVEASDAEADAEAANAQPAQQLVLMHRAMACQIKALSLPAAGFKTNRKIFPTLSKRKQTLVVEVLLRLGQTVRILLDGPALPENNGRAGTADAANIPQAVGKTECFAYLHYIKHLRQRPECTDRLDSDRAQLELNYLDRLKRPLQPLKDHLEFAMYETLEKDTCKYDRYEEAILMALQDRMPSMDEQTMTIAVAGAGRGPLVQRAIQAFQKARHLSPSMRLRVLALEKNSSVAMYLQSRVAWESNWQDGTVTVIETDARKIRLSDIGGTPIDIVVSELLGSLGDNELSPECLDPLLRSDCCKPSTISIPMQYTAYVAPVSSMKLHAEARQQGKIPHECESASGTCRAMETPYMVRSHAASQTHVEQLCWTFEHPSQSSNMDREVVLEFQPDPTLAVACGSGYGAMDVKLDRIVRRDGSGTSVLLHGLLGSFSSVLYRSASSGHSVTISTAPCHDYSVGVFSWFPLYLPFRQPLRLPATSSISVELSRKTESQTRMWYEWSASIKNEQGVVTQCTTVHNPDGRSSDVSMECGD